MGRLLLVLGFFARFALAHGVEFISDDVIRVKGEVARPPVKLSSFFDEDCKAKIKESVCLVTTASEFGLGSERPCVAGSEKYVPIFLRIHDRLPPYLQKMFCRVERIYIEKDLRSTAYANPYSSVIGMRQSLFDQEIDFAHWATWKEQLTFGGKLDSYDTDETLPSFVSNGTHEDFVMNVVIHEFGHLFDFANDLNASEGIAMKKGSYGAITWANIFQPLATFDYEDRKDLCVYDCEDDTLPRERVARIYGDLYQKTNFLNTYTSRNAREDFADTFAFAVTFDLTPLSYVFETRQGASYDLREEMKSDRMANKMNFIKSFIESGELLYP